MRRVLQVIPAPAPPPTKPALVPFCLSSIAKRKVRLPSRSVYTALDTFLFVRPGCNYTSSTTTKAVSFVRGGGKKKGIFFFPSLISFRMAIVTKWLKEEVLLDWGGAAHMLLKVLS